MRDLPEGLEGVETETVKVESVETSGKMRVSHALVSDAQIEETVKALHKHFENVNGSKEFGGEIQHESFVMIRASQHESGVGVALAIIDSDSDGIQAVHDLSGEPMMKAIQDLSLASLVSMRFMRMLQGDSDGGLVAKVVEETCEMRSEVNMAVAAIAAISRLEERIGESEQSFADAPSPVSDDDCSDASKW